MRGVCLAQARHLPPIISGGEIGRRAEACVLARRPGPPAEAARLDDAEPLPDVELRPMRPPPRRPAAAPPAFMFRMVGTRRRILKIQASLTAHWHDKGADWRGLAHTQAHHRSRLSDSVKNGNALRTMHNAALPAR